VLAPTPRATVKIEASAKAGRRERDRMAGRISYSLRGGWWLVAGGCWLLAVGCWLLAVGCWLLAVGCWLLAVEEA
jgi:hypothetical protein